MGEQGRIQNEVMVLKVRDGEKRKKVRYWRARFRKKKWERRRKGRMEKGKKLAESTEQRAKNKEGGRERERK